MMQLSGEFRRYADEQAAENTVLQRRVQNALRDAATRIDALERRCLELDAACCDYQRQSNDARRECCTWQALESGRRKEDIAVTRGWDCFAHTDGASSPEIPDNCPSQERVRDSYKNGNAQ